MISKISIVIIFVLSLQACKSQKNVSLINCEKEIHQPGLPSGKAYTNYYLTFKSENNFEINSVNFLNDTVSQRCHFYDLQTGTNSSILKKPFKQGSYKIFFRIDKSENSTLSDTILINLLINKKLKTIKATHFITKKINDR